MLYLDFTLVIRLNTSKATVIYVLWGTNFVSLEEPNEIYSQPGFEGLDLRDNYAIVLIGAFPSEED